MIGENQEKRCVVEEFVLRCNVAPFQMLVSLSSFKRIFTLQGFAGQVKWPSCSQQRLLRLLSGRPG